MIVVEPLQKTAVGRGTILSAMMGSTLYGALGDRELANMAAAIGLRDGDCFKRGPDVYYRLTGTTHAKAIAAGAVELNAKEFTIRTSRYPFFQNQAIQMGFFNHDDYVQAAEGQDDQAGDAAGPGPGDDQAGAGRTGIDQPTRSGIAAKVRARIGRVVDR